MRILIVSDTHGRTGMFDLALQKAGKIDALFHLGDVEGSEGYIEAAAGCPVYLVAGNNDFYSELPYELLLRVGGHKILMTHGHTYYVSRNRNRLKEAAKRRGADIVMYGHTHYPEIDYTDEIIALNPGSLTYPRQEGRRPTFIVMEIAENGEVEFQLDYL